MSIPNSTTLSERWTLLHQRIAEACAWAHRDPKSVRLVAVTKGQSQEKIAQLHALGQRDFGENYADELETKAGSLPKLCWIYIGRLQSNKIQRIVRVSSEIQSVESLKHVRMIARYAETLGKTPFPIYILINLAGEAQKGGVDFSEALHLAQTILEEFPQLCLEGLMAIPPELVSRGATGNHVPSLYRDLAQLAGRIGKGKLSLGMSQDLEAAVTVGATTVRVGTSLLGPRGDNA